MKLSEIEIDVEAVEQGRWIGEKYGSPIPEMGELCLKVRGLDNFEYKRMALKLANAIPRAKRNDHIEHEKIQAQCLNAACLLDWDGIEDASGNSVPYSKQQASELLTNPKWRKFRDAVAWASAQVGIENAAAIEADAKN